MWHVCSVVVARGLSRSAACGIFPDQRSNLCPLHWQVDSKPLDHQGNLHLKVYYVFLGNSQERKLGGPPAKIIQHCKVSPGPHPAAEIAKSDLRRLSSRWVVHSTPESARYGVTNRRVNCWLVLELWWFTLSRLWWQVTEKGSCGSGEGITHSS